MKTGATARGRGINIWMCSQQVLMSMRWCASAPLIGRYSRRCRSCVESFVWAFSSRSRYSRESENRGLLGNRVAEGIVLDSSIFVMRNAKLASIPVTSLGPIVKIPYPSLYFLKLSWIFQNNHYYGCFQIQFFSFWYNLDIFIRPYANKNFTYYWSFQASNSAFYLPTKVKSKWKTLKYVLRFFFLYIFPGQVEQLLGARKYKRQKYFRF